MSTYFINRYRNKSKCPGCKNTKLSIGGKQYSMCRAHLDKLREQWRCWQEQRREEGKCISCNGKSFNGWLRCKEHTLQNREKCKRWMAANKEYVSKKTIERREFWIGNGMCICKAHNPLPEGRKRCEPCRGKKCSKREVYRADH